MEEKLLTYFSFDKDRKPYYLLTDKGDNITKHVLNFNANITIKIDLNERFCIGGHDIGTHENWACEDHAIVDKKYEQCKRCMDKTGFNPAFYYSDSISSQQEEYNKQPHSLYLAYFDEQTIKVGITRSSRSMTRLLEQGARSAIILDEFSSANIARQYEHRISKLDWIHDNLKISNKIEILSNSNFGFDKSKEILLETKQKIESQINVNFKNDTVTNLDQFYGDTSNLRDTIDMSQKAEISGKIIACIGSFLITQNEDNYLLLPLKKFIGYKVIVSDSAEKIDLPVKQFSLF